MPKILVIEDDKPVQETIVSFLEEEGFDVLLADDGHAGLALAQSQAPDLIICDVMMPGLDGYGVLEILRKPGSPNATTPFIFLTARADRPDMRQGMTLGADDYLTKPFTLDELMEAIQVCLKKRADIATVYETEIKLMEERLVYALYHDSVTSLPNQFLLRQLFTQAIEGRPGGTVAVAVVSLDRFQRFVTGQSHSLVNSLLEIVATRLKGGLPSDAHVVRLHGDQFAVLLPAESPEWAIEPRTRAILDEVAKPMTVGRQELYLTGSMGIARYPADGDDVDTLIRKANLALADAAKTGNTCRMVTPAHLALDPDQLEMERDLHRALVRDELQLHYQPQVDLKTGMIIGAEALIRWDHPTKGRVAPLAFIPLAEETGLILAIGEWVLRTACCQIGAWQEAGLPTMRVSVNVSGRQFHQQDLTELLGRVLRDTGLEPGCVDLEVTEGVIMHDIAQAVTTLEGWRSLGARVSMDDFGTGYSSLSYLKELPFHTVKIDQSFVRNVDQSPESAAIITAIIQMAHDLGLSVIAEGVETPDELRFLASQGCDEIQGYLFSRPLSAANFTKVLREHKFPDLKAMLATTDP